MYEEILLKYYYILMQSYAGTDKWEEIFSKFVRAKEYSKISDDLWKNAHDFYEKYKTDKT